MENCQTDIKIWREIIKHLKVSHTRNKSLSQSLTESTSLRPSTAMSSLNGAALVMPMSRAATIRGYRSYLTMVLQFGFEFSKRMPQLLVPQLIYGNYLPLHINHKPYLIDLKYLYLHLANLQGE